MKARRIRALITRIRTRDDEEDGQLSSLFLIDRYAL
jgi:hypothetical protein